MQVLIAKDLVTMSTCLSEAVNNWQIGFTCTAASLPWLQMCTIQHQIAGPAAEQNAARTALLPMLSKSHLEKQRIEQQPIKQPACVQGTERQLIETRSGLEGLVGKALTQQALHRLRAISAILSGLTASPAAFADCMSC